MDLLDSGVSTNLGAEVYISLVITWFSGFLQKTSQEVNLATLLLAEKTESPVCLLRFPCCRLDLDQTRSSESDLLTKPDLSRQKSTDV